MSRQADRELLAEMLGWTTDHLPSNKAKPFWTTHGAHPEGLKHTFDLPDPDDARYLLLAVEAFGICGIKINYTSMWMAYLTCVGPQPAPRSSLHRAMQALVDHGYGEGPTPQQALFAALVNAYQFVPE